MTTGKFNYIREFHGQSNSYSYFYFILFYCGSQFQDIFDVDYFIGSLRDELRILKELPPKQKKKVEFESLYSMPPISWSNMTYYYNTVRDYQINLLQNVNVIID